MNTKKAISDYIDSCKNDMINDLRTLARIASVAGEPIENMPFGEGPAKALAAALELCKDSGMTVRNVDNYVGTADYFPDKEDHLGILCHMDVVPAGNGWSVPPFDITERDGKLIGRGAIDDKGPAVAVLYAIKTIKALGLPLEKNVRLILGTNEENGSTELEYYTAKEALPPLLFTPDGSYPVINIEKGMIRTSLSADNIRVNNNGFEIVSIKAGKAVNAVPEQSIAVLKGIGGEEVTACAEKLGLPVTFIITENGGNVEIEAEGKSAHASLPETGENTLTALFTLISALDRANSYPSVKAFAKLFPYGETDGLSCGISSCDDISGAATTVLSVAECDGNKLVCRQDIRFPVCESCAGITSKLKAALEPYGIALNVDLQCEPHHVSADSGFVKKLLEVYEDVTGEKGYTVALGGLTYVHDTENGVAFGAEFPGDENNMHNADEFIRTESLLLNAKIYANAILRLCGKDE